MTALAKKGSRNHTTKTQPSCVHVSKAGLPQRVVCVYLPGDFHLYNRSPNFQTKNAHLPILYFLAMPPSSLLPNKETGLGSGLCQHKVLPDIYEYAIVKINI